MEWDAKCSRANYVSLLVLWWKAWGMKRGEFHVFQFTRHCCFSTNSLYYHALCFHSTRFPQFHSNIWFFHSPDTAFHQQLHLSEMIRSFQFPWNPLFHIQEFRYWGWLFLSFFQTDIMEWLSSVFSSAKLKLKWLLSPAVVIIGPKNVHLFRVTWVSRLDGAKKSILSEKSASEKFLYVPHKRTKIDFPLKDSFVGLKSQFRGESWIYCCCCLPRKLSNFPPPSCALFPWPKRERIQSAP